MATRSRFRTVQPNGLCLDPFANLTPLGSTRFMPVAIRCHLFTTAMPTQKQFFGWRPAASSPIIMVRTLQRLIGRCAGRRFSMTCRSARLRYLVRRQCHFLTGSSHGVRQREVLAVAVRFGRTHAGGLFMDGIFFRLTDDRFWFVQRMVNLTVGFWRIVMAMM